jgi:hypothetical protein
VVARRRRPGERPLVTVRSRGATRGRGPFGATHLTHRPICSEHVQQGDLAGAIVRAQEAETQAREILRRIGMP